QLVTQSLESGRGRCPYSPHEPFTGLLIGGELYSGTSSDFMGSSAAFFRTWVHGAEQSYIRTEQNQDHWLHGRSRGPCGEWGPVLPAGERLGQALEPELWSEPSLLAGGSTDKASGGTCAPAHVPQPEHWECPCVTQCPSETYDPLLQSTKDFPDELISFMRSHQLMWEPVYPQGGQPVLVRVNVPYRLRRLLVHRLDTQSREYDVLFLGTDDGKVLKVALAGGVSHGPEVISLEEISVTKVQAARVALRGLNSQGGSRLTVGGSHLPWAAEKHRGVPVGLEPSHLPACHPVSEAACRLHFGAHTEMGGLSPGLKAGLLGRAVLGCPRQAGLAQGPGSLPKVVFGVEKNSTFLECLARSPQITIRWLVRRGEETAPSEVRNNGHFLVLEQGLLIRQLAREDVGTYECQAVDRSFSRPLTRYSLRVIRHEATE
ncbi:SEM3D protein, partial [Leiothrix lutea]|nr:SEM3D protein [Leiothrix lutea]